MQQMYSYPNCGAQVAFGVRFCTGCGTTLNWPTQQQTQPPPVSQQQRRGQGTKMRKIIGWAVTIIGGFYIALLGAFALDCCITGEFPPVNWLLLSISIVLVGIGTVLRGGNQDGKGSQGVCSKCGAQNKPGLRFCGSCGAKLS